MSISNNVPNYRLLHLFNRKGGCIFASRQLTNSFKQWSIKILKLMPGSPVVELVAVASFQPFLRRAGLFLVLSFFTHLKLATNG